MSKFKLALILIGFVLFIGLSYTALHFYFEYQKIKDPSKTARNEIENVVEEVSRIMVLPTGETPTLATVSDPEKLKGQAFFANAQTGDRVLIYPTARKAILYNPRDRKIVDVTNLTINTDELANKEKAAPEPVESTSAPRKR